MRFTTTIALVTSLVAGSVQACDMGTTAVADVYPSGAELPENLLRFYIYFSAPMSSDDIIPKIDLLDADGNELDGVFLSNRFDLWSADRTRLTLLLDPGRVKTGLVANLAMGRALVAGEAFQLRVADSVRDAQGCPLSGTHLVSFRGVVADMTSPDPNDWVLDVPQVATRAPLTVTLDGPVDHLSLAYRLRVVDPQGGIVPGRIALGANETTWQFTPNAQWTIGTHQLFVDPLLEDLAGNRMDAVFDLDLGSGAASMLASTKRMIPFVPNPS